jgi:hypothetical protein
MRNAALASNHSLATLNASTIQLQLEFTSQDICPFESGQKPEEAIQNLIAN